MSKYRQNKKPIQYLDLVSEYLQEAPETVEGISNSSTFYFIEWAFREIYGAYTFTGLPEGWDLDYMLQRLFIDGHFAVTDTELGVLPLQCGFAGVNVFNHPNKVIIANPVLGSFRRYIADSVGSLDTDRPEKPAALVKLQYNYAGIMPLVTRYAVMLAMCDSATAVNLINSKTAVIFAASNQKEAQSYKLMYDEITGGKPGAFIGDSLAEKIRDRIFFQDVKNMFIAKDLETVKRQIKNDLLSDIGVNNANQDKRERMITDEVNGNEEEVRSAAEHWIETVNEGLTVANKLYNLNLRFVKKDLGGEKQNELSESSDLGSDDT